MHEFDSVSVSTYEASSLAAKLTAKSAEGWDVVAIVPTGSDITAFLRREGTADTATGTATDTATDTLAGETAAAATAGAVTEPAGWGSAPASSTTGSSWGSDAGATSTYGTAGSPSDASSSGGDSASTWGSTTSTPASTATTSTTSSTPNVPPGWYADPAGRFELRYWDGSAWTEHVSRAGQQYTDPPVA